LPDLPLQYADYAAWQRQWLQGETLNVELAFWRQALAGSPPSLDLATDRPRPREQRFAGSRRYFVLPRELRRGLDALARDHGVTLFMVLLAGYQALLSRYSGQDDLLTGTPIANRTRLEIEPLIGFFVNTLVLRGDLSGDPVFGDLLARTREMTLAAFAHQDFPFEKLVEELHPERDLSHAPLFQTMFAFQNASGGTALALPGLQVTALEMPAATAKFDLSLVVEDAGEELPGALEYDSDLFDAATADRIAAHFERLLAGALAAPAAAVHDLPLLQGAERQQVAIEWNATAPWTYETLPVHRQVEVAARLTPHALAIAAGSRRITYRDLDLRAARLAAHLRRLGVGREDLVGLYTSRSIDLVVGALGVLKAGAAYVPLDPELPAPRLDFILRDTGVPVVLTHAPLADRLGTGPAARGATVVRLDRELPPLGRGAGPRPAGRGGPDAPESLAYVIYTSGSSGLPKGVAVTHRGLSNLVAWHRAAFAVTAADRAAHLAGLGFDAAVWDTWSYLTVGASLCMPGDETLRGSPDELWSWLGEQQVTIAFLATPMAEAALQLERAAHPELRALLTGGDRLRLPAPLAATFRLVNNYGPTETTVIATSSTVPQGAHGDELPAIGRPIANTRTYLMDRRLHPVPLGVPGELCLAGEGLGRGYLKRPDLTAERFVPDPWGNGGRLYRSGDLCRHRIDGQIEFLGRLDRQVKLHGFRLELGEIEALLLEHPAVLEAVVDLDRGEAGAAGAPRLVAYVVPAPQPAAAAAGGTSAPADPLAAQLRGFLRDRLPSFMVPAAVVEMAQLPRSANGKIDRARLPVPRRTRGAAATAAQPARTAVAASQAAIWTELLRVPEVGSGDNFFELGGDSILAIQVVARAARIGIRLTPRQIFQHQTIAELAALAGGGARLQAAQAPVMGEVPLTPIQRWFFDLDLARPDHFNQSVLLALIEPPRPAALRFAVAAVVARHDALRLRFGRQAAGWRQFHAPPDQEPPWCEVDLAALPGERRRPALEAAARTSQASLDLAAGPLLRVVLFGQGSAGHRLLLVAHHLVVDGVSWRILLEELEIVYGAPQGAAAAAALPPKTTSFRDWAERLERYSREPALAAESSYWMEVARSGSAALPRDLPPGAGAAAPRGRIGTARVVSRSLAPEETRRLLHEALRGGQVEINDLLLAALALALRRWTGRSVALVDLEGHGREAVFDELDVTRTVGWFTTLFPVRLDAGGGAAPAEALQAVRKVLREVPQKGFAYGLLRFLSPAGGALARGAAEVSFNYLGQFDQILSATSPFGAAPESAGGGHAEASERSHLLEVTALVAGGSLTVHWGFSPEIHREETIAAVAESFQRELRGLVALCASPRGRTYAPADFPLAALTREELDGALRGGHDVEDLYPASPLQGIMLAYGLAHPDSAVGCEQLGVTLAGGLDVAALERAWQEVVDRHPALRTSFAWEGLREPLQRVSAGVALPWVQEDWRGLTPAARSSRLQERTAAELRPFDLRQAPLMRLLLIQLEEESHFLLWSIHHAVIDGWCQSLVLREVVSYYEDFRLGRTRHRDRPAPYRHYISWLQARDPAATEAYWRRALAGLARSPRLRLAATAPAGDATAGFGRREAALPVRATARISSFARRHRLTLNTVVKGAWTLLLARYTAAEDLLFGAVFAGRPADLPGVEEMVGLFMNILPVRARLSTHESILQILQRLQDEQADQQLHEHTPLSRVQEWSGLPPGLPLFESLLVVENYPIDPAMREREQIARLRVEAAAGGVRTNYPLTLAVGAGKRLAFSISYDRARFDEAAMARMERHLAALFESLPEDPARPCWAVPMLGEQERRQVSSAAPGENQADQIRGIYRRFRARARQEPAAIAVAAGGTALTYEDLDRRVLLAAGALMALEAGPGDVVAVYLDATVEAAVALLAVLAVAAGFLALDRQAAAGTLGAVLAAVSPKVALTRETLRSELAGRAGLDVVCLDSLAAGPPRRTAARSLPALVSGAPACLARWPGGKAGDIAFLPLSHGAVERCLDDLAVRLGVAPGATFAATAGLASELGGLDLLLPLAAGAQLQLAAGGEIPAAASHVCAEPATWYRQLDAGWRAPAAVAAIVTGEVTTPWLGAALAAAGAIPWRLRAIPGLDGGCDADEWTPGDAGTRWRGTAARARWNVLDRRFRAAPVGVAADLYVSGPALPPGILGRCGETAAIFVPDPAAPGGRMVATGLAARLLEDGSIECLGRVGGHAPGAVLQEMDAREVESALSRHPALREVAVIARQAGGTASWAAAVVAAPGAIAGAHEIQGFLRGRLPPAAIPADFESLDAMPRTAGGDIDREALARIPGGAAARREASIRPRNLLESQLVSIWQDVLERRPIGVTDNFFELGGSSLMALRVMSRVRQEFGRDFPLSIFFQGSTIEDLALILRNQTDYLASPVVPIQPRGAKRPLLLVHPSGGGVMGYSFLVPHLAADQPLYGLEARHREVDYATLEEMAAHYVEALIERFPEGPYRLGGWSFGGLVAFEMASQLAGRGRHVELLVIFDTPAPIPGFAPGRDDYFDHNNPEDLVRLLEADTRSKVPICCEEFQGLSLDEARQLILDRAKQAHIIPSELTLQEALRDLHSLELRGRLAQHYVPAPAQHQPLVLFRCEELAPEMYPEIRAMIESDQAMGWGRYACGPLTVLAAPGNHAALFRKPHVDVLGQRLAAFLERFQASGVQE
jgi:amino acid adenylation domain-containing protein/non-ribosomal peptide synthase protein (TIGR01720 family)